MNPSKRLAQTLAEAHQISVGFLLTEIQTASTSLDLAKTTASPEHVRQSLHNAEEAYRSAVKYFLRVKMTHEELVEIRQKINALQLRLGSAGVSV